MSAAHDLARRPMEGVTIIDLTQIYNGPYATFLLAEAGAGPEHLVRLTWYVIDKAEYLSRLAELGRVYRNVIGRHYPAMALVQVVGLVEDRAKIEIEATAVIPEERGHEASRAITGA